MNTKTHNIQPKGCIDTNWDEFYLDPKRFSLTLEDSENLINSSQNSNPNSNPLINIINNLTNIPLNKEKNKNNSFKTELTTTNSFTNTNKFEQNNKIFNPILFKLIANDNIKQLKIVLKNNKNININEQDKDGDTPLHISVFLSNVYAIKILIESGADIYILDKWGQTSLHRICFSNEAVKSLEILNIFIKNNKIKQNIFDIQDKYGNTPCHLVLKHIIKNNTIINLNYKKFINKIISKTSKNLSNTDGYTIDDLVKKINL